MPGSSLTGLDKQWKQAPRLGAQLGAQVSRGLGLGSSTGQPTKPDISPSAWIRLSVPHHTVFHASRLFPEPSHHCTWSNESESLSPSLFPFARFQVLTSSQVPHLVQRETRYKYETRMPVAPASVTSLAAGPQITTTGTGTSTRAHHLVHRQLQDSTGFSNLISSHRRESHAPFG